MKQGRPRRSRIARSLQELALLWQKPPPDPGRETAPGETEAADRESSEDAVDSTPMPKAAG